MRWRFLLLVAVVILTAACSTVAPSAAPTAEPTSTAAPAGFATPEDAARAYIAGVANADVDAILAASAVDDAAEGFDFVGRTERLKILQVIGQPGPAEYPFYADINRSWFANRLLGQAQTLSYSLLLGTEVDPQPVQDDGPQASAFVEGVDPAGLAELEVVDVRPPDPALEDDPQARENALATAAIYGAVDDVQRVVLLKLGDAHYEMGFELLKYGDAWKVIAQTSSIAGLPATGSAVPITPEEFEEQTSGD